MSSGLGAVGAVEARRLEAEAVALLDAARAWPPALDRDGVRVAHGRVNGRPTRFFFSSVVVAADLENVARYLADEMVERLPEWSAEFVNGELLEELEAPADSSRWRFLVRYATPFPLKDREYHYWLQRRNVSDGEVLITYESLPGPPASAGCVRAALHGTLHRLVSTDDGTRIEHILGTELRGAFTPWIQSTLLTSALVKAHERDAIALRSNLARIGT